MRSPIIVAYTVNIWTRLVVLISFSAVLLSAAPAYAHTTQELDEWSEAWGLELWQKGEITFTLMWQYADMANRHPCYFRNDCPAPPPHTHPLTSRTPNVNQTPEPITSVERWRSLVATFFRAADVDRALRIMRCESGGDPNIMHDFSNPASASGLFQHLGKYWVTRSAAAGYGGASIFDPTANVAVAAWLRDQRGGWSHWVCR